MTSSYNELCGETYLFSKKPKTFPLTKPSCYWNMYSDLIYSEHVNFNTSTKNLSCRKFIKEQCGLETNDTILWMNKQEQTTTVCIENYFIKSNKIYDEEHCKAAIETSNIYLALFDLPFCSVHYAHFSSNFSFNLNDSMLDNLKTT